MGVLARIDATKSQYVLYSFELRYVLVPLLLKHGLFFLTKNRIDQYNLLLFCLENNIKKWDALPKVIPDYSPIVFKTPFP